MFLESQQNKAGQQGTAQRYTGLIMGGWGLVSFELHRVEQKSHTHISDSELLFKVLCLVL